MKVNAVAIPTSNAPKNGISLTEKMTP